MKFPDRSQEIEINRESARQLRAQGDHSGARRSYFGWVESVRQQNVNLEGKLERDLEEASREYSDFVKTDPLYLKIRDAAIQVIRKNPGVLQTELYSSLPQFDKEDIQYAAFFMDDHGAIIRTKKGRTYSLSLP